MKAVTKPNDITPALRPAKLRPFNAHAFLESAGIARTIIEYRRSQRLYSQGDLAATVMYIQKGGVKLSVVSKVGKEAVVALLGPGDFFGEGAWLGSRFGWG